MCVSVGAIVSESECSAWIVVKLGSLYTRMCLCICYRIMHSIASRAYIARALLFMPVCLHVLYMHCICV